MARSGTTEATGPPEATGTAGVQLLVFRFLIAGQNRVEGGFGFALSLCFLTCERADLARRGADTRCVVTLYRGSQRLPRCLYLRSQ